MIAKEVKEEVLKYPIKGFCRYMDNFNYIDIVVLALVGILGFKGLFNGLVKEFFGLFGIIGGVFVASRYSLELGVFISENLYYIENRSAINLVGFIAILLSFWIASIVVGRFVSKLVKLSALELIDRIFGFIFGAGKIFLIFAIITYTISNIEIVKKNISSFTENSITYPILLEAGSLIIRLDGETFDLMPSTVKEQSQEVNREENSSEDNKSKVEE